MAILPTNSNNSYKSNLNQVNNIARDVQNMKRVQVFKDEDGTNRVILGKTGEDSYGLKVSKTGNNVFDASGDSLVFNSDNNVFKIVEIYTMNTPTVSSGASAGVWAHDTESVRLNHNLGFTPAVVAYVDIGDVYLPLPWLITETTGGDPYWLNIRLEVYPTYFSLRNTLMSYNQGVSLLDSYPVKIYALQETAN